jgi:hypothetical protein
MPHPTQKSFEVIESHSLIITVITRCRVSDVQNWNHNTVVHFVFMCWFRYFTIGGGMCCTSGMAPRNKPVVFVALAAPPSASKACA